VKYKRSNSRPFDRAKVVPGVPLKGKIILSLALLAVPGAAFADQLIPAGTIIQCTIGESGKISSQTEKVGDPVMCTLSHTEKYGRASFPFGSYLTGRFVEYKDPGHFVGKGHAIAGAAVGCVVGGSEVGYICSRHG